MGTKRNSENMSKRKAKIHVTGYARKQAVEDMMLRACCNDVYAVDSIMAGVGYAYEDGCIAIVSTNGYVKMPIESARIMASELLDIVEDIKDLRRMGAQV